MSIFKTPALNNLKNAELKDRRSGNGGKEIMVEKLQPEESKIGRNKVQCNVAGEPPYASNEGCPGAADARIEKGAYGDE